MKNGRAEQRRERGKWLQEGREVELTENGDYCDVKIMGKKRQR